MTDEAICHSTGRISFLLHQLTEGKLFVIVGVMYYGMKHDSICI